MMGAELGQTDDPLALIPGDARMVIQTAQELAAYGEVLQLAGAGLDRIDTSGGWSGAAADAFRRVYHVQPGRWQQAGRAFHEAAAALGAYAATLTWAQGQAADAIGVWNSGKPNHQAAAQILSHARGQLDSAGNTAAATVTNAARLAPPGPSFWSKVGSFFSGVGRGAEAVGDDLVNGLLSVGNAMIHHPGADASLIGGTLLAGISAGGDAAGVVLDATGVGAIAGVPLNAISTAGLIAGVGISAAGAGAILSDAAGPDRVNIMHADAGSGSGGGETPRSYSSNPGRIANETGYTRRQINDAIHAVKNQPGWRGLAGNRNPDVMVDTSTGEVYPELPDGGVADDSIGNIYDYLPDEPEG
jgi:hypothetical protein